jgi:branched-subunit amino acid transport protein
MTQFWIIVGMALGVYAIRLAGFMLADLPLPVTLERALHFVPLAMLAALCIATFPGHVRDTPTRLAAAGGAALVAYASKRTWACILSGMALYWLFRWLLASR